MSDATPPVPPSSPTPPGPAGTPAKSHESLYSPLPDKGGPGAMDNFFYKLLGPSATPDQIHHAIKNLLDQLTQQIKQDQKKAKEASRKLRDVIEGRDNR